MGAFAALTAMLAWRSRDWPLVHDAPILHYIAWRIGEGATPYRDLFDMNQPGVYLLHLAVLKTLGAGDLAWRAFDLGWLAVGALAVAAFAAPWGRVAAAGGALVFALYHLAGGAWQAGQRDFLLCPFLLVGALGVARWLESRGGLARLAWSGAAMGAAVTLKPHAGLLALVLGAVVVVVAAARGGLATAAPAALVYAGAVALAPGAMLGWLAVAGALGAWRETVFGYLLPLYSRLGREAPWTIYRWQAWLALAAAGALAVVEAVRRRRFGARHAVALTGVAYGVVHYVGQGKGWEYHLYPLAAFASALAFAGLASALAGRRLIAVPMAAALLATLIVLGQKGVEASSARWERDKAARVSELVQTLRARLSPGDTVQMLDTSDGGAHALLRLGLRQPTRFVYDFHFFHDVDSPVVRGLRSELVHALDAQPPRFIVLFEHGWPAGGYERIGGFPELAAQLATRYAAPEAHAGFRLYAKRHDP
ncbi:MAG TPA: hypothetical protein VHZ49_18330 [Methylomirabilota bacterium]|nr:hypothetical protein [Methylomirabilota bacterium]